jgi:hypothetical protein
LLSNALTFLIVPKRVAKAYVGWELFQTVDLRDNVLLLPPVVLANEFYGFQADEKEKRNKIK